MAEVLVGPQPRSLISLRNPYQILNFLKDSLLNCCQALSALGNHEQICGFPKGYVVLEVRYYGNVSFPYGKPRVLHDIVSELTARHG